MNLVRAHEKNKQPRKEINFHTRTQKIQPQQDTCAHTHTHTQKHTKSKEKENARVTHNS
jgi:hypothetical protein